jgi:phage-related protein
MTISEELRIVITSDDKASGTLGKIGGALGKIGKVALVGAAVGVAAVGAGIAVIASKAIPAASNLEEAVNAVNVVFGENSEAIHEWGKTAAETAGLSRREFEQMGAQTGAMLINFGLDAETAAEQTINLAQRAADMASIFNTDVDQALVAIQAGLRGEADPLEKFGVSLSAAAVKAKALEMGLGGATGEMDNAAMTTARLALLFEQTDKIAGDFINTSEGLANASRVQAARWENFMASIGSKFLPIVEKFQGIFMDLGMKVMPIVEDALDNIMPVVEAVSDIFASFIDRLSTGEDIVGAISNLFYELALAFGASDEQAEGIFFTIGAIIEKVQEFGAVVSEWVTGVAMPALQEFAAWFMEVAYPAIVDFVSTALPQLIAGFQQLGEWITQIAEFVFPLLAAAVDFVTKNWKIFMPIIAAVGVVILALTSPISLIIGAIVLLATAWANNWGGIRDKVTAALDYISGIIESVFTWITNFWTTHGETIMAIAQGIWDAVVATVQWFIDYVTIIFEAFSAAFSGDWETFGEKIREAWDKVWQLIQDAVGIAWEFISTAVSDGVAAIIKWFTDTDWLQVGKDIISGIASGITAATQWVIDAVLAVARAIWDSITGFFGSHSYSTLMAGLGVDLMKGMAVGITASAQVPAMAAVSAGAGVAASVSSTTNTMTILGGINLPGVRDRETLMDELTELMV